MQGVYNNVNTKKQNADKGVNNVCNVPPSSVMLAPVKTANVLMTASFALNPVMSAVEIRQSVNPRGVNTTPIPCPTEASILSALSATVFRRKSKDCRNHIMIVARKITVKAL